ncbi:MAG: hypothetical protein A3K19_01430 [Lentisphaerae bacterium RIFOXYB12_FULL_65_16]|nr:MAG: hypothetical protein A3K18_22785 [Lentisphaerae bacterium RIFOXYA12_64_32]OGV92802.1 MAG: hypothetical protein A3K19_01430 [Lentisphaerae bacterium RIFOXYB12_FULL_65_16]
MVGHGLNGKGCDVLVTDGKCPHCQGTVDAEPIEIDQEVNCPKCGRLLIVKASADALKRSPDEFGADRRSARTAEMELFLCLTVICVFINMITSVVWGIVANILFVLTATSFMFAIYAHSKTADVFPRFIAVRLAHSMERLRVYPYEAFLVPGWLVLIGLWALPSPYREPFGALLLIAAIGLALLARRALREPEVIREQNKFLTVGDFFKSLASRAYRDELRKKNTERLAQAESRFSQAAEEHKQMVEKTAEKVTETKHNIEKKQVERKQWQSESDERYKKWMDEESERFKKK